MKVELLAHTQLSEGFYRSLPVLAPYTDAQAVALTAIRTCYSPNKPSEIVALEGGKYFGRKATDGEKGNEADRLIRFIVKSGHTSTLEHITFTFGLEGVSRALLAQLTRHRVGFSFSVQSQRYVKQSSDSKHGGFDYVVPEKVKAKLDPVIYKSMMEDMQRMYDLLIKLGISQEDARSVLPNAATTNLVLTVNLRSLLDFYSKRRKGKGAQHEITELAERLREEVVKVEPWTDEFFRGMSGSKNEKNI